VTCKLTYAFADSTSSTTDGWTESFYIGVGSAEQALAIATAPGWLNERLAFLFPTYRLVSIRAQNVASRFDNRRQRFAASEGQGQYAAGVRLANQGEAPWTGVLLRLISGSDTARSMTVRGIASNIIGDNLEYSPVPQFRLKFDQWREDLTVAPNAYQLRKMSLLQTFVAPTTIAVQADRRTLTLTYGPGLAPALLVRGALVQLPGIQNATPTTGLFRVQATDGTTITLFPRRRLIYGTPTVPVSVRLMQFQYFPITDSDPIRGAERKAGRPSDQLRGRARARQG
jgi:hypothetical protein